MLLLINIPEQMFKNLVGNEVLQVGEMKRQGKNILMMKLREKEKGQEQGLLKVFIEQ